MNELLKYYFKKKTFSFILLLCFFKFSGVSPKVGNQSKHARNFLLDELLIKSFLQ